MPNLIKYSTTGDTLSLKKGNYYIGVGDVGKGPTNISGYWNGVDVPPGGYIIYKNKSVNGPAIWFCSDDDEFNFITNNTEGTTFTSTTQCFSYYSSFSDKMVFNQNYQTLPTNSLSIVLDPSFVPSYPTSGTTFYNIGNNNNPLTFSLVNGVSYSSDAGGSLVFDGVDDEVSSDAVYTMTSGTTFDIWAKRTSDGNEFNMMMSHFIPYMAFRGTGSGSNINRYQVAWYGMSGGTQTQRNLYSTGSTFNNNVWYNFTFTLTYDLQNLISIGKIHVNGVFNATDSIYSDSIYQSSSIRRLRLGNYINNQYPFPGNIGRFLVYDRVLSDTEILNNYNNAKTPYLVSNFKTRVLSDLGLFESESCLTTQITQLNNQNVLDSASLIVTPTGYKENELYNFTPIDGKNLLLQTEEFTTPWNIGTLLDIENYSPPYGDLTAKKFTVKNTYTTGNVIIQYSPIPANLVDYTFSIFVKNINAKWILLQIDNNFSVLGYWFNTQNYTLGSIRNQNNETFNVFSLNNFEIINYPDNWKRIIISVKNVSSTTIKPTLFITNTNETLSPSTAGDSFALFAPQLELGSTATDYEPTGNSTGGFNVVRATRATRVNPDGLIETVPYNIFTRTEEFENAVWTKQRTSILTNNIIDPNGTLTGENLVATSGATYAYIGATGVNIVSNSFPSSTTVQTISFYLKYNGLNRIRVMYGGATTMSGNIYVEVDLQTGTITSTSYGAIASNGFIEAAGNGWYRVGFTSIISISATNNRFGVGLGDSVKTMANGVDGVYIWGAQIVLGDQPKSYLPVSTGFNIPRINHTSSGSCPSILIESQRSNILPRSQEFDNASWYKTNSSVIPNAIISPEGLMTADKLVEDNTLSTHNIGVFIGGSELRTNSIFVKAGERSRFILWAGASSYMFDLINLTTTPGNNSSLITSTKIESYGNGWYRCSIVVGSGPNNTYQITLLDNLTSPASTTPSYQGDGVSGLYIWGAQRENATSLTSYIPTTTGTVTRNADNISKTVATNLIGQTEGTIFLDFYYKTDNIDFLIFIYESLSNYLCRARIGSTLVNNFDMTYITPSMGGAASFTNSVTLVPNTRNKIAVTYDGVTQRTRLFCNGLFISERVLLTTLPLNQNKIDVGISFSSTNKEINNVSLWKTQLTDEQAINITKL